MLRWKLLKYFIALFPLVSVLILPISEPIKKQVLDRNEVRWYRTKDPANRTETIAVKNGADTAPSKVRIKVGLPPNLKSVVSDYDFRVFENGPKASFLNYVVDTEVLPGPEKKDFEDILRITDRHSKNRTLYAIDKALDESLQSQLEQAEIPRSFISTAGNQQWTHDLWMKNCIDQKINGSSCKEVDAILNKWEFSRLCLWSGAERDGARIPALPYILITKYLQTEIFISTFPWEQMIQDFSPFIMAWTTLNRLSISHRPMATGLLR